MNYLWDKAHAKAMERRRRTTANCAKDPAILWEALDLLREEDWSPEQISADMKKRGKNISHELIYHHIRADESGELASHCRHKMKYNRHGRSDRTTRVKNIPDRVSIHQRPAEADGTRFGDWEMDTIVGKDGKGAIVTLTERSTNMILMERHDTDGEAATRQTSRASGQSRNQTALPIQEHHTLHNHRQRI